MKMKQVFIHEQVYERLIKLAEKDDVDIDICASVQLNSAMKDREKAELNNMVQCSMFKDEIEKWLN